jgi:hydrogenase expression/formation protein HypD
VATIIGEAGFRFLPEEYRMPGVISGFEPEEILTAVYLLLRQIADGAPKIQNAYPRAVRPEGNVLAKRMLDRAFTLQRANWRGLGEIPQSGFALREEFADYDAAKRFRIHPGQAVLQNGCRCGDVITGKLRPRQCPLFEKVCTPEDPVGPCMVSSEGACAAAYKYQEI